MRNLNRKGTEPQRKSFKILAASHKWECSRPQIHRLGNHLSVVMRNFEPQISDTLNARGFEVNSAGGTDPDLAGGAKAQRLPLFFWLYAPGTWNRALCSLSLNLRHNERKEGFKCSSCQDTTNHLKIIIIYMLVAICRCTELATSSQIYR
jgi:hypothetical protein